jgi:hypothetical protein
MIDEARQAGLLLSDDTVDLVLGKRGQGYAPPDPDACLHNSLVRGWPLVEFIPKPHWNQTRDKMEWRANRSRHRSWPPEPVVHDAAWQRNHGTYAKSLPVDAIPLSKVEAQGGVTTQFGLMKS